ncbi:MAG: tRNA (N6-isopentenyl adenosine(37)-C2)-methylthiotransferase MiaB [Alphaproteobacteria bacterium]|nr:tRNA (N6-isopentenyl adenosine(37)-C2)-methylthiotransferase MiaB [Alphaproteobacteria bacterium]
MTKKIHIKTYGCQMNVYDSDRMQDLMNSVGYENSDNVDDSDIVIINTCHIREKASEKLFSDLGRIKPYKEKMHENGKQMIVAVAGCVAQAEGQEIFKRSNVVDIIVGPESYQTLPDLVGKVIRDKSRQINLDFKPNNKFDTLPLNKAGVGASAFVTVQEGCDKFCSFCVVPYTRGAEYSRDVKKVLYEINGLVDKGVSEIYLLGQNVNAYHGIGYDNNPTNLARLIEEIAKIPEIKRIRYTTSHPLDMNDDLINAHRDIEKLMPFLHLPIQSGSNSVLKAMNRKHSRQDYFKIIEKLRKVRPDMGLSSDFIVGFPNESEKDFYDTIDLVEKIGFTQCYSFKYSPRQGTPSADSNNQVAENIKDERLAILQKLLTNQQIEFNLKFEKTTMPVLFEKEAPKSNKKSKDKNQYEKTEILGKTQIWGKSPWLQSVVVELKHDEDGAQIINKIKNVEIIKSRPSSLMAKLIKD